MSPIPSIFSLFLRVGSDVGRKGGGGRWERRAESEPAAGMVARESAAIRYRRGADTPKRKGVGVGGRSSRGTRGCVADEAAHRGVLQGNVK